MNTHIYNTLVLIALFLFLSLNCKKETILLPPTVTTASASNITSTSASCGGEVSSPDGSVILQIL